ncbi:centromere-associated protein E-like [Macrobrachium rosenbergii]|uniref:centromere-associated protein E-like n=1 Tax=Macrobrachium rosenbergii TaxID=79674 RepID=UPI0034D6FAB6
MSDNILVAVRLRPLIQREISDNSAIHWQLGEGNTVFQINPATRKELCTPYKFDRVFGMDYENADIFFEVAQGIVESALAGFNGTIFAYGQTSSGKTYTMMGEKSNPGIIPLAIQNIFNSIENNPDREYLIRVSFLEIYNEAITDLLATRDPKGRGLTVREDSSGAVYVVDLKEECVSSEEMLLSLMRKGNKNRHVGATNMNDKSSRSHTIFRLIIESRERSESDNADEAITVSHLNLVDLAGSENASQTGATGERLKEGGFINKSLFMLGRVISQLSEGDPFVNFRDSKLTRILQSSLGGNAKTAIVCTVTPVGIDQTHSTLRFASRAKSIKNKPVINEVLSEAALLKRYAKEIKCLQMSLDRERNTDRAQEVEQVREMLDEKERINQELVKKINELKTKLIVSSHPREAKDDKKKKLRRETWAAPRALRAMRQSMAPVSIEPVRFDSNFLEPRLPSLAGLRKISEESSGRSDSNDSNTSVISDGFGAREVSFINDFAEQSKLEKLESSFDSLDSSNLKPWRRVHFKLPNHEDTADAECQTDESLIPYLKLPLRPQTPTTPGTPASVLRLRNRELMEDLSKKDDWLKDWGKEMRTLSEFHRNELASMEESFQRKLAEGPVDYEKLEEKEREIEYLQHSLSDSEALLLDANRSLSKKNQELAELQEQVQTLLPKSLRLTEVEREFSALRSKYDEISRTLDNKEERLSQLENERNDFDMMMELALEKQRVKERDLRRSLDDAWREIAEHEKGNVEEVKDRHHRMSSLEAELTELRKFKVDFNQEELEKQLQDALERQQEYEKQLKEQSAQLSQVSGLEEQVKKMEAQVSEIEILKTELYKAEDLVKMFEKENVTLKSDVELLQSALKEREGTEETKRIQELELEVEMLREKLEGVENADSTLGSNPLSQPDTNVTSRISRKLSETLQVLEESMLMPATPGKNSTSFCETFIQPYDVEAIKQQLLDLQAALVSQELQCQSPKDPQDSYEDALLHQMICNEIAAEAVAETNLWKLTESFYFDYLSHCTPAFDKQPAAVEDRFSPSVPARCTSVIPDSKMIQSTTTTFYIGNLEGSPSQDLQEGSALNASVLPADDGTASSASMEMTLNDCFEVSMLDTIPAGNEELLTLKEQLKILKEENSHLVSQVEQLKNELDSGLDKKHEETLGSVTVDSLNESVLLPVKPRSGALSLADELRDAGMNGTFCNDTFETSVLEMEVNPAQENEALKQRMELLSSENASLQNKLLQLQIQLGCINDSDSSGEASVPPPISQHDLKTMEAKLEKLQSEKNIAELEAKKLREELTCARLAEEEAHSLRWQVESLKEENSDLEEEVRLYESGYNATSTGGDTAVTQETNEHDLSHKLKEMEEMKKICEQLKEDLDATTKELVESKAMIDDLRGKGSELESIKADLNHKEELLREAGKNFEELKEELNEKMTALEETKSLLVDLQDKNSKEGPKATTPSEAEKRELDLAREMIQVLEQELETQQKATEEKIAGILDEKESELESVITNFMEKEEAFERQIKDLAEERKKPPAEKEEEDLKQKCSSLQVVIENLESTLTKKGAELLALEETCGKIQNDLSDVTQQHSNQMKEMNEKLRVFEEKCCAQVNEVEALRKKLEEREEAMKTAEEEKQRIEQNLASVMISLEEQQKLLKEKEEMEKLEQSCDQMVNEKCKADVKETDVTEENLVFMEKMDELEKLKNDLHAKVLECNELKDSVYNLKTLKAKSEEKMAQANEDHKLEVAMYLEDVEKKNTEIESLEVDVKERSERVTALTQALEAKENRIKHLERHVDELKLIKERVAMENEQMMEVARVEASQKVQELEVEIERLTKLSEEVSEDRMRMVEAINSRELTSKDLLTTNNSLKEQLDSLQDEHDKLRELFEVQHSEMLKTVEETQLLEKEQHEQKQTIQDLLAEKSKLQNDLDLKQAEISQKTKDMQVLEDEQEKMRSEVLSLNSKVKTMNDQHEANNSHIEKLIAIIEKFEADEVVKDNQLSQAAKWEHEALAKEERIKSLQVTVETQTLKIGELEKSLEDLHKENGDLKTMNSKMEKDALNKKKLSEEAGSLKEKLALAEKLSGEVQSRLDLEMRQREEELSVIVSEKQQLIEKLRMKEEELTRVMVDSRNGLEEIQNLKDELQGKKEEVSKISLELVSLKDKLSSLTEIMKTSEQKMLQQNLEIKSLKEEKNLQEEDFKELHNSNGQKIEGLVKIVEKLEHDISLKQAEMVRKEREHETEVANKSEKVESLMLEVTNKSSKLAEVEETLRSLCSEKVELLQRLDDHEKQLSVLKMTSSKSNAIAHPEPVVTNDSKDKIQVESLLSENKDLVNKLLKTEEQLEVVKGELQKTVQELQSKEEECSRLDAEMEDMVEYYNKERKEMGETLSSHSQDLQRAEADKDLVDKLLKTEKQLEVVKGELQKTVQELQSKEEECSRLDAEMEDMVEYYNKERKEMGETLSSHSQDLQRTESDKDLVDKLLKTEEQLEVVKEELQKTVQELQSKEEECSRLDAEMEDMVEYYNKESKDTGAELNEFREKLSKSQLTVVDLEEKLEKTKVALSETQSMIYNLTITRENVVSESYTEHSARNDVINEDLEQLSQQKDVLEREIVSLKNEYAKLAERYSDLEKKCLVLERNNIALQEEVRTGSRANASLGERQEDLEKLKAVWSEEKENLTAQVINYKKEIGILRKSISEQSAGEQIDKLLQKVKLLEKELEVSNKNFENLAEECSGWKLGYTEQFKECDKLKEQIRDAEAEMEKQQLQFEEKIADLTTRLNTVSNESSLESSMGKKEGKIPSLEEYAKLREQNELLESERQASAEVGTSSCALEQLQSENARLQMEIALLKKRATMQSTETEADTGAKEPLEDRVVELERENSELRFRLRALNAPAEKEVQTLKDELSNATAKVNHLKAELRRIQNSNNVDSTICEMRGGPVCSKLFDKEEEPSGDKFDYNSRSGIVSEVQVLILQNKLYCLEKEKKRFESEHRTLEQHVEHYKSKAQEWKDASLKERRTGEKLKKEVESWRAETTRLRKEVEKCQGEIETQQFEIGSQRQLIEKMEKERRSDSQQLEKESGCRFSLATPRPVPLKDQVNDNSTADKAERTSESASYMRAHSTAIPSKTRIETLPVGRTPSNPQRTGADKEPLWYSAYKENKDYSRYKLPPGSAQKKKDEECKTQ